MPVDDQSRDRPELLISVIDDDPLRARSEARELFALASEAGLTASMRSPVAATAGGNDKGADILGMVGVVLSAGSLAATCVQVWLAKVPQRTIIATRPDGATLRITGREARDDEQRLDRFLAGGSTPRDMEAGDGGQSHGETPTAG